MKKEFDYEVKEIYPGTYLVNEFFSTMFILCGEKRALVIDCGTGIGDFKSVIERVTPLPYDVVMTHSHVDHIGGRGQFSDIWVSEKDTPFIKGVTMAQRKGFVLFNTVAGNKYSGLNFTKVKKEPTVHTVHEGDIFDLGGRKVKAFLTPGHTVGSVSYLDIENETLFVGDIANEFLFMFLPHCTTIDEMLVTLDRVINLDGYNTVWASHHTQPNVREDIKKYIKGAKSVAAKPKNALLPSIKINDYEGAKLFYRPSYIHKK